MNDILQPDDSQFELLAGEREAEGEPAPSRLKAKIYSALVRAQEESGALRRLDETRNRGFGLCVFENAWSLTVPAEAAQTFNCCRLCHARLLAERMENAPIYWKQCPYVSFGKK